MENNINTDIKKIGIYNHYIHDIGSCNYLRNKFSIDSNSIVNKIKVTL